MCVNENNCTFLFVSFALSYSNKMHIFYTRLLTLVCFQYWCDILFENIWNVLSMSFNGWFIRQKPKQGKVPDWRRLKIHVFKQTVIMHSYAQLPIVLLLFKFSWYTFAWKFGVLCWCHLLHLLLVSRHMHIHNIIAVHVVWQPRKQWWTKNKLLLVSLLITDKHW